MPAETRVLLACSDVSRIQAARKPKMKARLFDGEHRFAGGSVGWEGKISQVGLRCTTSLVRLSMMSLSVGMRTPAWAWRWCERHVCLGSVEPCDGPQCPYHE